MPLLDHFLEPVSEEGHWRSFAANWIVRITDSLYRLIPEDYVAFEFVKSPVPLSLDVEAELIPDPSPWRSVWQPPPALASAPAFFPGCSEVHVFREFGGKQLVAVVMIVGPADRDEMPCWPKS